MQPPLDESTFSALTCDAVLVPPAQHIGEGDERITYIQQQPAWHCDFSSDGTCLAVCYGAPDPCVRIWRTEQRIAKSGESCRSWTLYTTLSGIQKRTIRSVKFAPITKPLILASASFDGTVAIWEEQQPSKEWDCTAQLEGHDNECKDVAWNASGTLLATCGRDKTVWIWEAYLPGTVGGRGRESDFECLAVLNGHEADVKCVQFAPSHGYWGDGEEIVLSGSYDDTIRVWAEDGGDWYCAATLDSIHSSTIWSITVAPSGTRFVSASDDGSLTICKSFSPDELPAKNGKKSPVWQPVGKLEAHKGTIYSVDYANARVGHGRIVSSGADNRILIYRETMNSTSSKPTFQLDAGIDIPQAGDINCVKWHPWDGNLLASVGDDGRVRIWNYTM